MISSRTSVPRTSLLGLLAVVFAATPASSGEIRGEVRFEGEAPRMRAIRMQADPNCEKLHEERVYDDSVLLDETGRLANVFVYLEEAPPGTGPFEVPETPARLEQEGCRYVPRVQGVRVRQELEVVNADPTLHNVRSMAEKNRPFNLGQPAEGKRTKFFTEPEKAVGFQCDVHPWMSATIFVMDHPFFATSDRNGAFVIDGLPDGHYTLTAWHEVFGELSEAVIVANGRAEVRLVFSRPG